MTMTDRNTPALESIGQYLFAQPVTFPESLLHAMLDEVALRAEPETLRAWCNLFGKMWGERAHDQFKDCDDLSALNSAVNAFLARNNWGWCEMSETEDGLRVEHGGAPLLAFSVRQHVIW